MRNIYLLCIAICIVVSSCKKDSTQKLISPEVSTTLHEVSFTVPGFESTAQNLSTNSAGGSALLKDQIKYLHLVIYKDRGIVMDPPFEQYPQFAAGTVKDIVQKSTDANFGTFKASLSDGQYWFYIVGDQLAGKISGEITHGSGGIYWTLPYYHLDNALLTSGIYFGGFDTLIKAPISKAITIKRMVSKLTVRITDAIPANAAKFILTLTDYPPAFDLFSGNGKYIYTGALFTKAAQFTVSLDTKWNAPVNIPFSVSYLKPIKTRK